MEADRDVGHHQRQRDGKRHKAASEKLTRNFRADRSTTPHVEAWKRLVQSGADAVIGLLLRRVLVHTGLCRLGRKADDDHFDGFNAGATSGVDANLAKSEPAHDLTDVFFLNAFRLFNLDDGAASEVDAEIHALGEDQGEGCGNQDRRE